MSKLIYSAITSLDGYVADAAGKFDWAEPDEEVHRFLNELERPVGTYLYGRRMYQVMAAWEAVHADDDLPSYVRDFAAIWQAAEKIVFSRTLESPSSTRTRIEREFTPERIREIKTKAARDLTVGGPTLATEAIKNGLIDEWHLFIAPVLVGGGTPFLRDRVRVQLELLDHHRFANGMLHLRYRTRATRTPRARETAALPMV